MPLPPLRFKDAISSEEVWTLVMYNAFLEANPKLLMRDMTCLLMLVGCLWNDNVCKVERKSIEFSTGGMHPFVP